MKSKEIEKYEIMKLKYAEDTRAHGKQLRQLQFRRTRLGCPRRSFRSRRRPPEAAWATIARVAGPRRPRVGRPRFEHRRPDADATAADDVLHFGGVLWSQVEHAAAASGMSRATACGGTVRRRRVAAPCGDSEWRHREADSSAAWYARGGTARADSGLCTAGVLRAHGACPICASSNNSNSHTI